MSPWTATRIIAVLEGPSEDRRQVMAEIQSGAPGSELTGALEQAQNSLTRQLLCDLIGRAGVQSAAPVLVRVLTDESHKVRSAAADALAKLGDPATGEALLERFRNEPDPAVLQMLATALGAVGHRPAIADLLSALTSPDAVLRGCAAWSLGELRAREASDALRQALAVESGTYAMKRIKESLGKIDSPVN